MLPSSLNANKKTILGYHNYSPSWWLAPCLHAAFVLLEKKQEPSRLHRNWAVKQSEMYAWAYSTSANVRVTDPLQVVLINNNSQDCIPQAVAGEKNLDYWNQ